jgi:hypothetical protein
MVLLLFGNDHLSTIFVTSPLSEMETASHSKVSVKPILMHLNTRSKKSDCVGHVQKRMGSALRKVKKDHGKRKLSDGRTIGGAGRLTEQLCDDFQRYYGNAIRDNLGNLQGMVW